MSERQLVPRGAGRQHANVVDWLHAGSQHGFGPVSHFAASTTPASQMNVNAATKLRVSVPTGIEGRRYELLALSAWLNLIWGSYDYTNLPSETFVPS
ncbi:hypothetical protein PENPOL_c010G05398 [Penicillium polonicum]|uniref:Uncharacterized protein n=1 Tax=Penicillium polonicum TaxID=60169 RepID=A0A1V6NE96_PENPO|nr:hypothetical protein PENPOL_c010G05398 [Penicillium polonicum]